MLPASRLPRVRDPITKSLSPLIIGVTSLSSIKRASISGNGLRNNPSACRFSNLSSPVLAAVVDHNNLVCQIFWDGVDDVRDRFFFVKCGDDHRDKWLWFFVTHVPS